MLWHKIVGKGSSVSLFGPRGVFGGGSTGVGSDTSVNTIDYITIATTGNATDFGDLTVSRNFLAAVSGG